MADVSTTIFEELRKDITTLAIKPGEKIGENDICERFSVTRPPVRAAFHRLQDMGLLEVIPYRGARATLLNLDAICQMIFSRVVLESRIIRDFVNSDPSPLDIEDLEHNLRKEKITSQAENVDSNEFFRLDSELHQFWFDRMRCSYIWKTIQSDPEYERFRMLDFVGTLKYGEIIEDHELIVEAIKNKDSEGISRMISKHLNNGLRRMRHVEDTEFSKYFKPNSDMGYWKNYFDDIQNKKIIL